MRKAIMILLAIGMAVTSYGQNDPVSLSRNRQFSTVPAYTSGTINTLIWNSTNSAIEKINSTTATNTSINMLRINDSLYISALNGFRLYYKHQKILSLIKGGNNGGELALYDSLGNNYFRIKDSLSNWMINSKRGMSIRAKNIQAFSIDTFHTVRIDTSLQLGFVGAGTAGTDSLLGRNASTGAIVRLPPSASVVKSTVTLLAGVGTITDSRATISSTASYPGMKTPGGTLGVFYQYTFGSGTITVTARSGIGVTQTLDTSTLTVNWAP